MNLKQEFREKQPRVDLCAFLIFLIPPFPLSFRGVSVYGGKIQASGGQRGCWTREKTRSHHRPIIKSFFFNLQFNNFTILQSPTLQCTILQSPILQSPILQTPILQPKLLQRTILQSPT